MDWVGYGVSVVDFLDFCGFEFDVFGNGIYLFCGFGFE